MIARLIAAAWLAAMIGGAPAGAEDVPAGAAAGAAPANTRLIDCGGHRLAFHITPGTLPAIVLDAGGGDDSTAWDSLVPILARQTGAEIITYDRPGFGQSDIVPGPWDPQRAAADLAAGLRALGATQGTLLVPHSMAGQVATYLVRAHPGWFAGAVLVDASLPPFYTDRVIADVAASYQPLVAQLKSAPPTPAGRELLAVAASFTATSRAFHRVRWPEAVPATVIVSEKTPFDDPADAGLWRTAQAAFAAQAPNRRLVTAARSSHEVMQDRPDVIVAAVLAMRGEKGSTAVSQADRPYDLVIRNGRVLDGAGNPWTRADVAIRDGRFVRIGFVPGHGAREIDAHGDYVSPGWIDMMDQSGADLLADGSAENKVREGITTAIAGEGGAPVGSAKLGAYFDQLARQGISLNFGTYYGASQARVEVMGDIDGLPTAAQLDQERAHVDEAMRAGAFGIATALIYAPNSYQQTPELVELAKVAHRYGGLYASHVRDEGEHLLDAIGESIRIGEESGAEVEVFHFKGAYAPGWGKLVPAAGRMIDDARNRGVDIAADMYVYTAGGTGLDITVPNWVWAKGKDKGMAKLADPAVRVRLKQEIAAGSEPGWTNLIVACGGWEHVVLINPFSAQYDQFRYKSLAEIGKALHSDPADVAWDIILQGQPQRPTALFFGMSENDIETALRFPWMSIGSDAGSVVKGDQSEGHPRAFGNFPRVIAHYVRDRQVITLPDAIRKMTSWPATRMKLFDRGVIREGLRADVTIFDYDKIRDMADYQHPSATPVGIDYVVVNGTVVVDQGRYTGAKPGMILRGPGWEGRAAD